jgi:23S rRNA pseudouridine1911/1915/1917 synthase
MTIERDTGVVRFAATDAEAGERLDRVLAGRGAFGSRARAQALLRRGHVRVNGVLCKASHVLRAGDAVTAVLACVEGLADGDGVPAPEDLPLDIRFEDADLLAVNKAPGVVVHPAPGHPRGTLVNALLHYLGAAPGGGARERPGIIHRLDKDTSGIILVAKTAFAHERVARQFKERSVCKEYVAVVRGRLPAGEGTIDRPIGRHPRERQRMSVRSRRGRESVTRFVVAEDYGAATVVSLFPSTGRTHQLRVHLAAIGHPIVGDRLYGGSARRRDDRRAAAGAGATRGRGHGTSASRSVPGLLAGFPRQALHAAAVEFSHPRSGERVQVQAPLPGDLAGLLEALRAETGAAA